MADPTPPFDEVLEPDGQPRIGTGLDEQPKPMPKEPPPIPAIREKKGLFK